MSQQMIHEMVQLSIQDGQSRCIIELPGGQWTIKPEQYQGPGKRKYETINTAMGWMSRQVGENFRDSRSAR